MNLVYLVVVFLAVMIWLVYFGSLFIHDRNWDAYVIEKYTVPENSFLRKFFFWKRADKYSRLGWLYGSYFLSFHAIPAFITTIVSPIFIVIGIINVFYTFIPFEISLTIVIIYVKIFSIHWLVYAIKSTFCIWPSKDDEYIELNINDHNNFNDLDKFK